ncbi:MAG: hypothetical protein K6U87_08740 [Firmicutes bacterium]|nr:hypothetical protein [Bacillota bacterium]
MRGGFVQRLISWLVVHAWWVALGVIAFGGGLWVLGRSWIAALLWVGALALGMWGVLRLQARKAVHGTMGLALGIVLALFAVHTWQGARPLPVSHSGAGSTALGPHLVGVTAKTVTLHLDGNRPWTDSGLYLTAGETVRVQASGTIDNGSIYPQVATNGPNGQGLVTPSGGCTAAVTPQRGFIAPGLPCWSLIARVGTGEPFWIGTSATWTVHTPGELWFGVNNNVFGSSRGGWTVSVEVSHPA